MSADNDHSRFSEHRSARQRARTTAAMSLFEKTLIFSIIVGFGILHIVAGNTLHPAADKSPTETSMPVPRGD